MQKIIERLDALEQQNRDLLAEIKALRDAIKESQAGASDQRQQLEDRVEATEQHTKEQSQTKVSSSQRLPLSLTGMFLFDSYLANGTRSNVFQQNYGDYSLGPPGGGATLRQSIIGLDFVGPHILGDGQIHGSFAMDFYGYADSASVFRIRRGTVSFDWRNISLTVGQDKTLIAPLQPTSFARVGIPPLSGAGNLWLWRPQIRYDQRIPFSSTTNFTLQAGLFATDESYTAPQAPAGGYVSPTRPAAQVRLAFTHGWGEQSKFTLGVAAHASTSHLLGQSIPSRVISSDFLYKPLGWLELSGTLLHGENFANLGADQPGVTVAGGRIAAVRGSAGWIQLALPVTQRLTFDVYTGRQVNISRDLTPYAIARNVTYAGNVLYRLGSNVFLGFEGAQARIVYLNNVEFPTKRYDATVAYLF